jgi:hypothetical protein
VVVAVNGARTPADGLGRRLLRRAVLVAAFTGAGWLFGALFAGSASAAPSPEFEPPALPLQVSTDDLEQAASPPFEQLALLDEMLTGLAEPVGGSVEDSVGEVPPGLAPTKSEPVTAPEPPQLLPVVSTLTEAPPADKPALAVRPRTPAEPRAPPVFVAPASEHTSDRATTIAPTWRASGQSGDTGPTAAEHAQPAPQPDKAPAPPPGDGPTATTVHDNYTGFRGTHGALTAPTPLEPRTVGFSSRGRVDGVSGRMAGLPATSPD